MFFINVTGRTFVPNARTVWEHSLLTGVTVRDAISHILFLVLLDFRLTPVGVDETSRKNKHFQLKMQKKSICICEPWLKVCSNIKILCCKNRSWSEHYEGESNCFLALLLNQFGKSTYFIQIKNVFINVQVKWVTMIFVCCRFAVRTHGVATVLSMEVEILQNIKFKSVISYLH